ncbi:MAG: hypothetical protein M1813_001679 [Trichoglossum hirsutum]|nr:MAG: hypothetical protein M1813_001679 [Trichoglossum hirsutum]
MNWTGGRRSRHSHLNARSIANVQRQHFAKIRNRLHPKSQLSPSFSEAPSGRGSREERTDRRRAVDSICFTPELSHSLTKTEDDAATCDQCLARTRFNSLPAAASADVDHSRGIGNLASRRHILVTVNPMNPLLLANRKQKLLKRDDWVGTTITRPLKIRYPPAVDGQTIGKRRKSAGDSHRNRMLFAAEQAGLSRVGRGYVRRGDRHDWVAGEHEPTVRIGEPSVPRRGEDCGDESMRGTHFDRPYESTPLSNNETTTLGSLLNSSGIRANPTLAAEFYAAGIVAESPMLDNGSRVAALKIPRENMRRTQSSGNGTASVGRPNSPSTSECRRSVGYRDARPNRSDASLSSCTHLGSSRFTTGHNTHPQLSVRNGRYAEEGEVSPEKNSRQENNVSPTYVRVGSETTPGNRTATSLTTMHSRTRISPHNPQAETSCPKVTGTESGGGPDTSIAPHELFWRSWLSTFIRDETDMVEQTRTSCASSWDPNARECTSDAQADLNSVITHNAVRVSPSVKSDPLRYSTPSPNFSRTSFEHPLGAERRHLASPVRSIPILNVERKNRDEASSGHHTWPKYPWEDEGEDEAMDQFLGLDRLYPYSFSYQCTTGNQEYVLADATPRDSANSSYYSQQTRGFLLHSPTASANHLPTTTHSRCDVPGNNQPPLTTRDSQRQSTYPLEC